MSDQHDAADLEALLKQTTTKLAETWKIVGLQESEQQRILTELHAKVKAVFTKTVEDENKMLKHYESEIEDRVKSIAAIQAQLGLAAEAEGQAEDETLIQAATRLGFKLEELTKERELHLDKLGKLLAQLADFYAQLGQPLPEGMGEIGDQLTEARTIEFQDKITAAAQEVSNRKAAVAKDAARLATILKALGQEAEAGNEVDTACCSDSGSGGAAAAAIPVTDAFIAALSARMQVLEALQAEREGQVRALGEQIHALWTQLKVGD
eukprot:g5794.t1